MLEPDPHVDTSRSRHLASRTDPKTANLSPAMRRQAQRFARRRRPVRPSLLARAIAAVVAFFRVVRAAL